MSKISVSSLFGFKEKPAPFLNWNYTVSSTRKVETHKLVIRENIDKVDNLHLILHKPPLGQPRTDEAMDKFREVLEYCRITPQIEKKLFIDSCYLKLLNKEESECRASSQLHIWPSGVATVCPYDSCGASIQHRKDCGFIEAFKYLHQDNPFEICKKGDI